MHICEFQPLLTFPHPISLCPQHQELDAKILYAHLCNCFWHCLQLLLPRSSISCIPADKGQPMKVLCCFCLTSVFVCGAVYNMHFHNGTQGPLENFMIQFNKNSFGLAPGSQNVPVPQLGPGSTHSAVLPLVQSPALVSPTAASSLLQVCSVFGMHTCMHLTTL